MSETVAAPAPHSVTLADGAAITSAMTAVERYNVTAKSLGVATVERPTAPAQFLTPATLQRIEQLNGRPGTAPPPSNTSTTPPAPAELEASRRANIEAFDAEMREKGIQKPLGQPRDASGKFAAVPADQVDQAGIEELNKVYRALPAAKRYAMRAQYTAELAEFYSGRKLGESRDAFAARMNGEPTHMQPPATSAVPAQNDGWKAHVVDGQIDLDKLTTAHTGGYTIPRFIGNQTITEGAIAQLRAARAAGISQAQVNAFLRQEAVTRGWVPA